jgi:hypothetical protein
MSDFAQTMKPEISFSFAMIGGDGNDNQRSIMEIIDSGQYEIFIAQFVNGLVHQGFHHTGVTRPVGETTAIRVAHDLLSLIRQLGGNIDNFDFGLFRQHTHLDTFKGK